MEGYGLQLDSCDDAQLVPGNNKGQSNHAAYNLYWAPNAQVPGPQQHAAPHTAQVCSNGTSAVYPSLESSSVDYTYSWPLQRTSSSGSIPDNSWFIGYGLDRSVSCAPPRAVFPQTLHLRTQEILCPISKYVYIYELKADFVT
jgi:hypothetical protein